MGSLNFWTARLHTPSALVQNAPPLPEKRYSLSFCTRHPPHESFAPHSLIRSTVRNMFTVEKPKHSQHPQPDPTNEQQHNAYCVYNLASFQRTQNEHLTSSREKTNMYQYNICAGGLQNAKRYVSTELSHISHNMTLTPVISISTFPFSCCLLGTHSCQHKITLVAFVFGFGTFFFIPISSNFGKGNKIKNKKSSSRQRNIHDASNATGNDNLVNRWRSDPD